MAMVNKKSFTEQTNPIVLKYGKEITATKFPMANIIMPNDEMLGRIHCKIFARLVKTHEHPDGYKYPSNNRPIFRPNYKTKALFDDKGMADAYTWTEEDYNSKKEKIVPIGFGYMATVESVKWAMTIVDTIENEKEKDDMILFLTKYPDLKLVFSKEEKRIVVEVTQEMIDAGLTEIVDSYALTDKNGMSETTKVEVGDFLVKNKESYYLIQKNLFWETHTI